MDFADLINLDYGYGIPAGGVQDYWAPLDLGNLVAQSSLSLGGVEPTSVDMLMDTSGLPPRLNPGAINATTPLSLGVSDVNGDPMRPLATDIPLGAFNPLGRVNPDGTLDTSGFARENNVFGGSAGPGAAGSAAQRLQNALDRLAKAGQGSGAGGGGGGGGNLGISMPRVQSPVAERIAAVSPPNITMPAPAPTGAIPAGAPPAGFVPLMANVPLAQNPIDPRGLERFLRVFGGNL